MITAVMPNLLKRTEVEVEAERDNDSDIRSFPTIIPIRANNMNPRNTQKQTARKRVQLVVSFKQAAHDSSITSSGSTEVYCSSISIDWFGLQSRSWGTPADTI